MNLSPLFVVARKELTDGLRDRRSIYTIFIVALLGPMLISFMLKQQAGQKKAAEEIRVPVVGRELAPVLVNWLEQQSGVQVVPGPADPEAAVRDRKEELVLVIMHDFSENFEESKSAPVEVFSDSTQRSVQPKLARLTTLLNRFNAQTVALRLIARGISPEVFRPLEVRQIDIANAQQRGATILNVMLMFLAMAVMTAGMQIATDSTAGERERGSLEPLLLNPVPRWQLIGGKWLASAVMAFAGMLITLEVMKLVVSTLPLEDLGIRFHLGRPALLMLIAAMGPLALLVPAMQAYLSCFARSFKEAQTYTAVLVLPVVFTGVMTMNSPKSAQPWMLAIPIVSQYSLGAEILGGKAASPMALLAAGVEAALLAGIFLWLSARLFSKEKIIFGR
jgi:sodium transport system permease protein